MALPTPAPGLVISYAYLWRDQAAAGAEEGRKSRPCAIVLAALDEEGDTVIYVAPITHAAPAGDDSAVPLPAGVKRRLGLDATASWIITRELNRSWPGYDLRPVSRDKPDVFAWGFLPVELLEAVKRGVVDHQRAKRLRTVDRR